MRETIKTVHEQVEEILHEASDRLDGVMAGAFGVGEELAADFHLQASIQHTEQVTPRKQEKETYNFLVANSDSGLAPARFAIEMFKRKLEENISFDRFDPEIMASEMVAFFDTLNIHPDAAKLMALKLNMMAEMIDRSAEQYEEYQKAGKVSEALTKKAAEKGV